jgi:parallel beta-helix repeat protein
VIDGAGFVLQGLGSSYYTAITLSNRRNVTIKNMDIDQFGLCISITQSSNITIMENKMSGAIGVALFTSSGNSQIIGNSMVGCGYGVSGLGSFNNIVGNNFTGSDYSVRIGGDGNTISENLFKDETSIMLTGEHGSKNNTISKNIMMGGEGDGIYLTPNSLFNIVFGNNIPGKSGCGIKIDCSYNNTVYENYLANNGFGIYIGNPAFPDTRFPNSKYNTFYRNNLVNNTENVHIEKPIQGELYPNLWDNGKEGNYWSDYNGTDSNGDGIGDTPYIITANNVDRYPFSKKEPFPTTMVVAFIVSVAAVGGGLLVYFKKRNHAKTTNIVK